MCKVISEISKAEKVSRLIMYLTNVVSFAAEIRDEETEESKSRLSDLRNEYYDINAILSDYNPDYKTCQRFEKAIEEYDRIFYDKIDSEIVEKNNS